MNEFPAYFLEMSMEPKSIFSLQTTTYLENTMPCLSAGGDVL